MRGARSPCPSPVPCGEEPSLDVEATTCHHKYSEKKRVNPKLRCPSLPDPATKLNIAKLSVVPKTELEKKGREGKGGKKQVTWN